ncbi:polysaccharide biosynthesis/export family protein [Roseovarius amoyensis]|uniref:polysaccharide biosynthesis/export family protein n=1 Tax=Roseovarius amoyensis TaxID=2211448 RepID=UPI001EF8D09F|nr:polysaccharide biosynthesis/export family protein [Roseovarius amoyensis]
MRNSKATLLARTAMGMALAAAVLLPAGCGVVYTSPNVSRDLGTDIDVRVISLTPETVLLANRTPYNPRNLPREFYAAANARQGLGMGALPAAPVLPDERPGRLELRLPPDNAPQPYRLGVGDVVLLATKSNGNSVEQLSGLLAAQTQRQGYTISDDGSISIPDIGRVEIGGLTLQEAQDHIFRFLLEQQVDPAFSLEVAEFNSQRVTVGGAVQKAVRVPITLNPLTLGEALTATGGFTIRDEQYASIRIYRAGSLYQIPYQDYLSRPALQDLKLINGDAVFVDTTYDLDRALEFYRQEIDVIRLRSQARKDTIDMLQAEVELRRGMLEEQRSNFDARHEYGAEARDYVYLSGEVFEQARMPLPYEQHATLADVLYEGGGFRTKEANARNIYVLRPSTDPAEFGAVTAWHLDAANAVNMTLATRMQMRPNDIVFVEEQPITKWNRVIQQVVPSLLTTPAAIAANN